MLQPCAAASPAVGNREIVRTDASSDGPDGVSPPGEGLISGALTTSYAGFGKKKEERFVNVKSCNSNCKGCANVE